MECIAESFSSQVRHPPLSIVRKGQFDGILTIGIIHEAWLEKLLALSIPTVMVDQAQEQFVKQSDQVYVDPLSGTRDLIGHFVANGLNRIHFVGGFTSIPAPSASMTRRQVAEFRAGRMQVDPDSFLRLGAFRQVMQEFNRTVPDEWVHFQNPFLDRSHEQLLKRLMSDAPDKRPQAVLCHSLQQAKAIRQAFDERNWPIQIAAITNRPYRGPVYPLRADGEDMGAVAADLLLSKLLRPGRRCVRVGVPMTFEPDSCVPEQTISAGVRNS